MKMLFQTSYNNTPHRTHSFPCCFSSFSLQARQAADDCGFDEEDVEEQTKKNTEYNEYLHPLMRSVANAEQLLAQHYPDLLRGPGAGSHQQAIPYAMASSLPSSSSQVNFVNRNR